MKKSRLWLISLILPITLAHADDPAQDPYAKATSDNTETLVNYLLNLGGYLGFNLKESPPTTPDGGGPSQELINKNTMQAAQLSLFDTVMGAVPVNAISAALMSFIPSESNSPYTSLLNSLANTTFKNPAYNTASSQQGTVSVVSSIDQQTYQSDPVSQAVLNILGTPDHTYCMSYDGTTWNSDCSLMYGNQITSNVIGKLPGTFEYFTYKNIQPYLSQLNSNTLLSPLLYSTNGGGSSTSSSQPTQNGLPAQSQAQQAANFIRYASGSVNPLALPHMRDYDVLYGQATNSSKTVPDATQKQAQATLVTYLASLRAFAAQASVGISNLYYMLSKRMPQNLPGNQISSQAMSEFTMASWRLFDPTQTTTDQKTPSQWLDKINNASSATIQKEVAILLAEINYQLYLNRQQDERILLTQTMLLMQNSRASQPSASTLSTGNPRQ